MTAAPQFFDPRGPLVEHLLSLPPELQRKWLEELDPEYAREFMNDWSEWGRSKQQPPEGMWDWWIILSGRGWGKTRVGSEWVKKKKREAGKTPIRFALIAETKADARDVIVEGDSGILAVFGDVDAPKYEPSKRRLTWANGSQAFLFSGEEPDQLRGPQFHNAWVDEWAKYQYPGETMDNLQMALRLGDHPQGIITTTPRPIKEIREMVAEAQEPGSHIVLTKGHTKENEENLAANYIRRNIKKYEGTRLGRQELGGEILEDVAGGLWTRDILDGSRWMKKRRDLPSMMRIVISVDPATTSGEDSNETGIIVAGLGVDRKGYCLEDLSGVWTPDKWVTKVITAYNRYRADKVVAEKNNGGDLVERTLRTQDPKHLVNYGTVWASRGKHVRAEPISALHEQGRIRMVGSFANLEDQLIFYTPTGYEGADSPDRGDAFVWAFWELLIGPRGADFDADEFLDSRR